MKKILLFAVAMLFVTVGQAQNKNKKEILKVDFYGIDFTAVNVVGATETENKFMTAFAGMNQLLVSEQSKYDVGKFLKLEVQSLNVDHAMNQVDKLKDVKFKDNKDPKISLKEIIKSYPTTQGKVLLIVAKELNKRTNKGIFIAVVFNGNDKQIVYEQEFSGKANGFGLRNFWSGAFYNGLKAMQSN